jgi:predicted nucleic acid-binding protein
VNILVDTSVWSLALRQDSPPKCRTVIRLQTALQDAESVFTTGLILQELLQGFNGPKAKGLIIEKFAVLPFIIPEVKDYVEAADLKVRLRRKGMQAGTIDSLLAQLCLRHDLYLLSEDKDFVHMAKHIPLALL